MYMRAQCYISSKPHPSTWPTWNGRLVVTLPRTQGPSQGWEERLQQLTEVESLCRGSKSPGGCNDWAYDTGPLEQPFSDS